MKLGIVCFANNSGLGQQTRRLSYMLKPDRLLVINSASFSKIKKQHYEWYDGFSGYRVDGFPNNRDVKKFLDGLTHVIVCENPLNMQFFAIARSMGVQTFCQSNFEFCDNLNQPHLPLPDMFLMPSYWKIDEMRRTFITPVVHLPPPIDPTEFARTREINFSRTGSLKLLHVVGTLATHDRNGTLDLLAALPHTHTDFTLVIKSQHELPPEYMVSDRRVTYSIGDEPDTGNLYADFDALILPRRYGGLALTCNEALMSGIPVFMPDISPNNQLLPPQWLYPAKKVAEFMARAIIDVYGSDIVMIAQKIDWIAQQDIGSLKAQAFDLGHSNFSPTILKPRYEELFQ